MNELRVMIVDKPAMLYLLDECNKMAKVVLSWEGLEVE